VSKFYNAFAGKNLDRLEGLSDGIFAVAFTLLVLDLRVPARPAYADEHALLLRLVLFLPSLIPYVLTFMTLGIFWVGQQAQLNLFARADRNLTWLHIAFLLAVTLMPFSAKLLAEWLTFRVALLEYWLNLVLLGGMLLISWRYAAHAGLLKEDVGPEIGAAVVRRIVVAQALYAVGAALCAVGTLWSIGFILLVQLNYAFAPKWSPLSRS